MEKRPFCFMNIHIHIINSVIPMGQIHTLYGLRYIKNITFSNMHMKIKAKYMIISCGKKFDLLCGFEYKFYPSSVFNIYEVKI